MKRPWDRVKLRLLWSEGKPPEAGDELHTVRGRRYLVLSCTEKQITALVLPKKEPLTEQRVLRWTWGAKRQQQARDHFARERINRSTTTITENKMLKTLARFLARPAVADWLIRRAKRTPYFHIKGDDGSVYMERYWLFNPYPHGSDGAGRRWGDCIPSIRLHCIRRPDQDRHLHDHPWNARTFILRGWYWEIRPIPPDHEHFGLAEGYHACRCAGDTATLRFGEYHRITDVSPYGVWTLFVTGKKRGTWGFLVDGGKVQWRKYLGIEA